MDDVELPNRCRGKTTVDGETTSVDRDVDREMTTVDISAKKNDLQDHRYNKDPLDISQNYMGESPCAT